LNFKFSNDGERVYISDQKGILVCDENSGKVITTIGEKNTLYSSFAVDNSDKYIACYTRMDETEIYRIKDNKKISSIPKKGRQYVFSNDASVLYILDWSGKVSSWDTETGVLIDDISTTQDTQLTPDISDMTLTPNGRYLITTTANSGYDGQSRKVYEPIYDTEAKAFVNSPMRRTDTILDNVKVFGNGEYLSVFRTLNNGKSICEIWRFITPQN
jgi:hypothetical protein